MPDQEITYTYRAGQKIVLEKSPDQFVVRALPEELERMGVEGAEQVSGSSSRVTTRASDLEPLMSSRRHTAPTHHAYYVADTGEEFLITDRIFVTFREALPSADVDAFAARYGLILKAVYSDRDYLFQLTDHTGMNPVKLVVLLNEQEPLVELADHDLNQRAQIQQFAPPTDPAYARQWHLHTRSVSLDFDRRASTRCEEGWQLLDGFGSDQVVVGVTDDGCKLDHPDFDSPGKFAGWGYFRGERLVVRDDIDADPRQMYKTGANHGTSCAGVIAGEADAVHTVGAAPGCRLLPIQWESSGPSLFISDSKLLTALAYMADKVDVVSNSWGITPRSLWSPIVVRRIGELAQSGGRRGGGIIFLWAAGNENCPIQHTAGLDVPFTSGWEFRPDGSRVWVGVQTSRIFQNNLVGVPGLMHVGALASTAQRSHYSNYGTGVLICAPTSNVHEYRRLTLRGLGITTTTGSAPAVTDTFGGTSSATPLVAGVAALVISANPALTALEAVSVLKRTAAKELNAEGYPRTPPASFDPNPTWDVSPVAPFDSGDFQDIGDPDGTWSPWFGHGRVDAPQAIAEALRLREPEGEPIVRLASAPELRIPDNTPAGVADTIACQADAALVSIKVTVDITHPYIGDLRVVLVAPSGAEVVLHNRSGGNADDLRRSFDMAGTPGLSALAGQPIAGDWTLRVQDLAARDVGRLNRWELEIEARRQTVVSLSESPGVAIPDRRPAGIERTLTVDTAGVLREIEVALDITHTYIGDLTVTLTSPSGAAVALHQRQGGSTDNLIATYTMATMPGLQGLRGQPVQGAWRLAVADLEAVDVGKLNRWSLRLALEA
jgi:subtilisin-like proprotein convertase family protein/subtilisin family serine protease